MKKLFLILALGMIVIPSFSQLKSLSTETIGMWTLSADTIQTTRLDKIVKASIYVPSYATDSTIVSGCTFIIDGTVTNGITIPPGEASVNMGFDYAYIDSLRIEAKDVAWMMLLIERD